MDKAWILKTLTECIESDLEKAMSAALESAESATHEESKSEGKYDTRGLETSYLASGQAQHAVTLKEALEAIRNFKPPAFRASDPAALGALVTTLSTSGRDVFFLAPGIGGIELVQGEQTVTVITSKSPIGSEMIGKRAGERLQTGGGKTLLKIE